MELKIKFLISNIRMENQLERTKKEIKYQNEKLLEISKKEKKILYI